MSTQVATKSVKGLLEQETVQQKFKDILKDRAKSFTANLAVMVNNSEQLKKCDPMTVISAAVVSATLDLPLDPNLGFAYVVPFKDKAQFQIGYKGFIQLAWRSGQYRNINVTEVCEGELVKHDKLTGECEFDWDGKTSNKVIGYVAYFELLNGARKTEYWDKEKVQAHGKRFSQTFKRNFGLWTDDFDSMGKKTVLKALLNRWGILSIEMQDAIKFDQGVIRDVDGTEIDYVDNEPVLVEENPKARRGGKKTEKIAVEESDAEVITEEGKKQKEDLFE